MSFLTKVLFERSLTDKLAADDSRTLPIVAGSGMALAGAGIPITLKILANNAAKFNEPIGNVIRQEGIASRALNSLNITRVFAEEDLNNARAELQNLRSYTREGEREAARLRDIAKAEAAIKEQERRIATIDKFTPKQQGKVNALQAERKNLEARWNNTLIRKLDRKLASMPKKYWGLARAGLIGLPIALTVGGAGLAGYNLYQRHQENKPWYEKLKDKISD